MDDPYNAPISTSDAASMLRTKIPKNTPPYTAAVMKYNNRSVDDWQEQVLNKLSDINGNIACGRCLSSWRLYEEGKAVLGVMKLVNEGVIVIPELESIRYWIDFFENLTIEEIIPYGPAAISYGWTVIENYFRLYNAKIEYDEFFSNSDDPKWWEDNRSKFNLIRDNIGNPLWSKDVYDDIRGRLQSFLMNVVKIQGTGPAATRGNF